MIGFENRYEVSDDGLVRSLRHHGGRRNAPHLLAMTPGNHGYRRVSLCDGNGRAREALVHHLVLEAFKGPCPLELHGLHENDDPLDNRLSNLRWATPKDNSDDARRNNRMCIGEDHPGAKLTPKAVAEIRARHERGETQRSLAAEFGIAQSRVSRIACGKAWRHIVIERAGAKTNGA